MNEREKRRIASLKYVLDLVNRNWVNTPLDRNLKSSPSKKVKYINTERWGDVVVGI